MLNATSAIRISPGSDCSTIKARSITASLCPAILVEFDRQPGIVFDNDFAVPRSHPHARAHAERRRSWARPQRFNSLTM
jgi:hypothetical protein